MDNKMIKVTIGNNIRKYRKAAGLTQQQLAEKVGVATSFISRCEQGQKLFGIPSLLLLADVLNVSANAILYVDGSKSSYDNIKKLLEGKSEGYVKGIEKIVRVCTEEFEEREPS